MYEQGQTIAHRAAAANDISMLFIIYCHGGDFPLLDSNGETALISLGNMEAEKFTSTTTMEDTTTTTTISTSPIYQDMVV